MKVHTTCVEKAVADCSANVYAVSMPHNMTTVHFDRPTWCDFCKYSDARMLMYVSVVIV